MIKKVNRNESISSKHRSRRINESDYYPHPEPLLMESLDEIENKLEQICKLASDDDFNYYIDYLKDDSFMMGSIDSSESYEITHDVVNSLRSCDEAVRNLRRALEDVGSASNTLRALLKNKFKK